MLFGHAMHLKGRIKYQLKLRKSYKYIIQHACLNSKNYSIIIVCSTLLLVDLHIQDVLEAADHLQFNEILSFCAKHLRDELTVENCLQFLKLAEMYGLQECKRDTKVFVWHLFLLSYFINVFLFYLYVWWFITFCGDYLFYNILM